MFITIIDMREVARRTTLAPNLTCARIATVRSGTLDDVSARA